MKSNSGKKLIRVHLLNGESLLLVVEAKSHVKETFDQVCLMQSIKENHFFGLSVVIDNESQFLDTKEKLTKYAPKDWGQVPKKKDKKSDSQTPVVFNVNFEVQFFVEHPKLISDAQSRHYYYLQIKKNLLQTKVLAQDELIFQLAATSLYIDLGSFDNSLHSGHYFNPQEYMPAWFIQKWGTNYLWSHLPTMHSDFTAVTNFHAQSEFIQQASTVEDVPGHFCKLFKGKADKLPSVILGITHLGIRIYHVTQQRPDGPHLLTFEYPWSKVGRLLVTGKRFEIYPEDLPASRRLTYYTGSCSKSKYLLRLLRDTHSLYLSLNPFVAQLRKTNGRSTKTRQYRESYISGLDIDVKVNVDEKANYGKTTNRKAQQNNFKSLQSSTSQGSSQTSGIGSELKPNKNDHNDDHYELDGSPSDEVICVTEEHLEAPLSKTLSVSNIIETVLYQNQQNRNDSKFEKQSVKPGASSPKDPFVYQDIDSVILQDQEGHLIQKESLSNSNTFLTKEKRPKAYTSSYLRRNSSTISEILDLFPDVSGLSQVAGSRNPLIKSVSEDKLSEVFYKPSTKKKQLKHFRPRSAKTYFEDSKSFKQRRSSSVDNDLNYESIPANRVEFLSIPIFCKNREIKSFNPLAKDISTENQKSNFAEPKLLADPAIGILSHFQDTHQCSVIFSSPSNPIAKSEPKPCCETTPNKDTNSATDQSVSSLCRSERNKNIPLSFSTSVKKTNSERAFKVNHVKKKNRPCSATTPKYHCVPAQEYSTSFKPSRISNDRNQFVSGVVDLSSEENFYTAKGYPKTVALRPKSRHKTHYYRPRSYDFDFTFDLNRPTTANAAQRTSHTFENCNEVLV